MNPSDLLKTLKSDSSEKVCQTLDAIFSICEDMRKEGIHRFTVASVSKFGKGRGVPRAQSIRNNTGEKYRALIASFSGPRVKNNEKSRVGNGDAWIGEIEDPGIRMMVFHQAAQLKKANEIVRKLQPVSEPIVIFDNVQKAPFEKLTDLEFEALEYILSEEFRKKMNVRVGIHGDYLDSDGRRVFKIATLDAVSKCIRALS